MMYEKVAGLCSGYHIKLHWDHHAHAVAGNGEVKVRLTYIINELRKVQLALGDGYLSAFPMEHFVRLQSLQGVWAPFYVVRMTPPPTCMTLSMQTNAQGTVIGGRARTCCLTSI